MSKEWLIAAINAYFADLNETYFNNILNKVEKRCLKWK